MLYFRNYTLVAVGLLLLTACGGGAVSPQVSSTIASGFAPFVPAQRVNPFAQLYVANQLGSVVTMYARGRSKLTKTLSGDLVSNPVSVIADSAGHVYVANCPYYCYYGGNVTVYSKNGKTWYVIRTGIDAPRALAIDSKGNLYVASWKPYSYGSNGGWIGVYPPGASSPSLTIKSGIDDPVALALDSNDNLFVASSNWVTEYAPGQLKPDRVLGESGTTPFSLAVDTTGDVYIGSNNQLNNIQVYPPGSNTPSEIVTDGIDDPNAILLDSSGTLYVSNYLANDVTIYPSGETSLSATISDDVYSPDALTLDKKGNLYVANTAGPKTGAVTVYSRSDQALIRKITDGVNYPVSLAFGP